MRIIVDAYDVERYLDNCVENGELSETSYEKLIRGLEEFADAATASFNAKFGKDVGHLRDLTDGEIRSVCTQGSFAELWNE